MVIRTRRKRRERSAFYSLGVTNPLQVQTSNQHQLQQQQSFATPALTMHGGQIASAPLARPFYCPPQQPTGHPPPYSASANAIAYGQLPPLANPDFATANAQGAGTSDGDQLLPSDDPIYEDMEDTKRNLGCDYVVMEDIKKNPDYVVMEDVKKPGCDYVVMGDVKKPGCDYVVMKDVKKPGCDYVVMEDIKRSPDCEYEVMEDIKTNPDGQLPSPVNSNDNQEES